jgi:hypothetical protein
MTAETSRMTTSELGKSISAINALLFIRPVVPPHIAAHLDSWREELTQEREVRRKAALTRPQQNSGPG